MSAPFDTQIPTQAPKKLTRSRDDKWIGGVCGGLAQYTGWNANLIRVLFVASCLLPGPQFLLYIALWIIIPRG